MFGLAVQIDNQFRRVASASDRATFRNLGHAAATVRKEAIASIEVSDEPSEPGTPPHTRPGRGGRQLPRAIRYDVDRDIQSAIVGPVASRFGQAGRAHELGGFFKGDLFDPRPFMRPVLIDNLDRFAHEWRGSIGE
jgi:hypothetical protein